MEIKKTRSSFDKIGKMVVKELLPYIQPYPFEIIRFNNTYSEGMGKLSTVSLLCKKCREIYITRIMYPISVDPNPFLIGMTLTRTYYELHVCDEDRL